MINIAHLSDIHITKGNLLHNVINTTAIFETLMNELSLAEREIDLLVISGDLADSGSLISYEILGEILDRSKKHFGCEVMLVPGNHDAREPFRRQFFAGNKTTFPTGRLDYAIRIKNWQLIGLDTLDEGHDYGNLLPTQIDWLQERLADESCLGSILVMHHPPVDSPTDGMSKIGLQDKDRFRDLLIGSNVKLILAGHYHHFLCADFPPAKVLVASATAYQIDPLSAPGKLRGYQGSAFNLIKVSDDADFFVTQVHRSHPDSPPVLNSTLEKLGIY